MPAEIDTGGPRVLHCDYRADCPIPILLSASNDDELLLRLSTPIVDGVQGKRQDQSDLRHSCLRRRCLHNHHHYRHHHRHQRRHHWRRWNLNLDHTKDIPTNEHIVVQDVSGLPTSIIGPCSTATATVATFPGRRSLSCSIETRHRRVPSVVALRARKSIGRDRRYRRASSSSYSSSAGQQDRKLYSCKNFSNNDRTFVFSGSSCSKSRVILREEEGTSLSSHRSRSFSREKDIVSRANRSGSSSSAITTTIISSSSSSSASSSSFSSSSSSRRFDSSWRRRKSSSFLGDSKCACRKNGRFYFQLAFLLFLLAFGHSGLLKSSSVLRFSARSSVTGLGIFAIGSIAVGVVSAAPIDLIADAGVRAERSANLSHITGASRKIQMYIKNRHLQILPDGTVNGSNDDTSDYTIFQRTSVSRGQLRIQGVATCLYLCMDSCGLLYGSREYTEDCVFNETLEQHNYNTYSSVRWSTAKKTLYLGLNRRGQPRRVQTKGHTLGRLSAYARVLTQVAPADRVEALHRRMLGAEHNVRHRHGSHAHRRQHHHQEQQVQEQEQHSEQIPQQAVCPNLPAQEKDGRDRFRCRKRKKRKKRKRRCRPGEKVGPQCQLPEDRETVSSGKTAGSSSGMNPAAETSSPESKRSCEGAASEEACRRQALSATSRKRKSRIGEEGEGEEEEEGSPTEVPPEDAAATASTNVNDNATHEELLTTSIGKNLEQATSKKTNVAGTISQSKKPDLLDGKKRKMKKKKKKRKRDPASPRRSPLGARKRYESKQTGKEEEDEEDDDETEEGEVAMEGEGGETAEEEKEGVNNGNGTSNASGISSSRREPVVETPSAMTSLLSSPSSSLPFSSNHSSSFEGARFSPKRKTAKTTKSPLKKNGSQALGARRNGASSKSPRREKALSVGSRRTTPILRQRAIRPTAILDSSTTATATTTTMTTMTTVTMTRTITTMTTTTSTIVPETRSTSNLTSLPRRDSTSTTSTSCCDTTETTTTNSPLASFAQSDTEKKESNERNATERLLGFERLAM